MSFISPFVDYDFGDIFPVLQSLPSADWEGGARYFYALPNLTVILHTVRSPESTNQACPFNLTHVYFMHLNYESSCACDLKFMHGFLM